MDEQIAIRRASESDLARICAISKDAFDEISSQRGDLISQFDVSDEDMIAKYKEAACDNESAFFVADANGIAVGYVYASVEDEPDDLISIPRAFVNEFTVCKEHRGKGVGRNLLCKVEEWAKQKELPAIHLTVLSGSKEAIETYTKQGYKTIMLFMEKLLD